MELSYKVVSMIYPVHTVSFCIIFFSCRQEVGEIVFLVADGS